MKPLKHTNIKYILYKTIELRFKYTQHEMLYDWTWSQITMAASKTRFNHFPLEYWGSTSTCVVDEHGLCSLWFLCKTIKTEVSRKYMNHPSLIPLSIYPLPVHSIISHWLIIATNYVYTGLLLSYCLYPTDYKYFLTEFFTKRFSCYWFHLIDFLFLPILLFITVFEIMRHIRLTTVLFQTICFSFSTGDHGPPIAIADTLRYYALLNWNNVQVLYFYSYTSDNLLFTTHLQMCLFAGIAFQNHFTAVRLQQLAPRTITAAHTFTTITLIPSFDFIMYFQSNLLVANNTINPLPTSYFSLPSM